MMDCKRALQETDGDVEKAVELLRVKGAAKAEKRGGREVSEGVVQSYIHAGNRVGVLVEVDCETDFVARNNDFIGFARDIALHIAAAAPVAVTEEDVPTDERDREARIAAEQAADKPENVRERIVEGKLRKWLEEVVLLRQPHVNTDKYEGKTIEELRAEVSAKTGENVVIRRFSRYVIGE
jgi:elongation factor Ts